MSIRVEFCGEWYRAEQDTPFLIGREGPLHIDDNPYLHRRFLQIFFSNGLWWLENIGSRLSATVSDSRGTTQAYVQPGARLPLVYERTHILFTAGPTTYEIYVLNDEPVYASARLEDNALAHASATQTIGPVSLTPSQLLLILALAEPVLRGRGTTASLPSSADAAARLGWPITRFNRKLDHVCERLTRYGVKGLHGGPSKLAVNRRARLVEHAVATRLVTPEDLYRLDDPAKYDDSRAH